MVDSNFASAIARDAEVDEKTLLIEIGPGTGCLTQALLALPSARVLAIEIDRGLAALLRDTFSTEINAHRLTLLEGDALAGKHAFSSELVDTAQHISKTENRPRKVLCANLPYNAATPLLAVGAIDEQRLELSSAVATTQLELAERMFASAGSGEYGALTALLAMRSEGRIIRRVGGEIFWPRPQVDSAVIGLRYKKYSDEGKALPTELGSREETTGFQQFLQTLFSQRRKTVRSTLKLKTPLDRFGIDENARAEDMTPPQLLALFRAVLPIAGRTVSASSQNHPPLST